jgi:hypothetical protein
MALLAAPARSDLQVREQTVRRLLRELERDGLVVEEHGLYRLADDLDPEMREALSWFTFDVPDPAAEPYAGLMVPVRRRA